MDSPHMGRPANSSPRSQESGGARRSRTPMPSARAALMALSLVGALVLSACGAGASSPAHKPPSTTAFPVHLLTPGVIQFAGDFTEPPGQLLTNGQMTGSDFQICNAAAKAAGLKPKWTNIAFGSLIPALQAGRVDAICSSVDMTAAREQVVDFVPYRIDSQGAAVAPGNPHAVSGPSSLCGLSAAELLGSIYQTFVQAQSATCVKEGKHPIALATFSSISEAFAQLLNGRASVVVGDAPILTYYVRQSNGKAAMAYSGVNPTTAGIAVVPGNLGLVGELTAGLYKIKASGQYQAILSKWGLSTDALPYF